MAIYAGAVTKAMRLKEDLPYTHSLLIISVISMHLSRCDSDGAGISAGIVVKSVGRTIRGSRKPERTSLARFRTPLG